VGPLIYIPSEDAEEEEEQEQEGEKEKEKKHEVNISPDDLLITGSTDTSIKIWSLYSGECLLVSERGKESIVQSYFRRELHLSDQRRKERNSSK